jgi:hypothetical protein
MSGVWSNKRGQGSPRQSLPDLEKAFSDKGETVAVNMPPRPRYLYRSAVKWL